MKPKVCTIVLNWNKPDDTAECLESCLKIDYPDQEILLVDNHSSDRSVEILRERFPQIRIRVNEENLGYAGGNNAGMRLALAERCDYVFLLNNDITLDPQVLRELVAFAETHSATGILAPKVLYYDDPQTINSLGTSMDWFRLRPRLGACGQRDDGRFEKPERKDILLGCALLIPRATLERVGLIDERFFIFHEEADWCYRVLKAGLENWTVPQAKIYHKASKTMREFSVLTHYYSTRNFLLLASRQAGWADRLKVLAGLSYLSLKHAGFFVFGSPQKKKMAGAFFFGMMDFVAGRLGKCRRNF